MRHSTWAVIVVALGLMGAFADVDFDPYAPKALEMLREGKGNFYEEWL